MRALVFGNSHTACLIEAWREVAARTGEATPEVTLEFFVRSGSGVAEYELAGTRIAAATEAQKAFLARLSLPVAQDLAGFDALVIVGSEVSLFHVVHVLNRYRILDWPMTQDPEMPALTEAVLRLAVAEALHASNAAQLMAALRAIPALAAKPIHLVPQPFVSERALTASKAGAGFKRLCREQIGDLAAQVFTDETARLAASFDVRFHPQPVETIVHGCLTAQRFTERARRLVNLGQLQPADDILHANLAYGRLILHQICG
ncbi:MAG: hypothetical protein JXR75_13785 [Rhodobacteraceae bacterium]|nr:hypothetical protein [Paracoccaceae bacterium]